MRRAAIAAALALLALPAAARADTTTITMPGKHFDPPRSTIVAGDLVVFRNTDLVTHDVLIGGVFDSGPMARLATWSQQLDQPGGYPFICRLHAFMSGNLDVVAATLSASPDGVLAGEPLTLTGRAPAGTAQVGFERSLAGGEWAPVGAGAAPAADGTFRAAVAAAEGASYRVTTAAGAGQVVTPRVTASVDVHLAVHRGRRHTTVHVHTMPATTGFVATLELYARHRYRWRAHHSVKLGSRGGASFSLPASRRAYARVALRRRRGGPALVHSDVVKLWNGRRARDPDTITPATPGGHDEPAGDDGGHGGGHP
jgi:plastocyanin